LLFATGIAAIILEFFIPAFGLVGLAGVGTLIVSVVIAFRTLGSTVGSIFLILMIILVPAMVIIFFKIFPRTPFGRRLILQDPLNSKDGFSVSSEGVDALQSGGVGRSLTDLRPSGMALFMGKRYSVVSQGDFIDKNTDLIVTSREGNKIVVKRRP